MHSDPPPATPAVPTSIWVVAWASLAGQLVLLVERGVQSTHPLALLVSTGVGALIVGYVSAGVVRARTLRLGLAWFVLVLSAVGEVVWLLGHGASDLTTLLLLATSVASLGGLVMFHRSAWFAWQRTRPPADQGASITGLVAVGVLVGVLGGLVGPPDDGPGLSGEVRVEGPSHGPGGPVAQSSDWIPASS